MADKAILFGINDYKTIADLQGCVNDVSSIESLLEDRGFDEVRTFTDKQVTKSRIKKEFKWLFEDVEEGARLVFHFSGHGSYIKSEDDDEEYDELLCLYGMDWDKKSSYLLDDELDKIVTDCPAHARLTIILDCCHSGTGTREVTRAMSPTERSGPLTNLLSIGDTAYQLAGKSCQTTARSIKEGQKATFKKVKENENSQVFVRFVTPPKKHFCEQEQVPVSRGFAQFAERMETRGQLNHQLLAGAADNQTAADAFIDGDFHGAFTYYLCENTRELGESATYQKVMQVTVDEIKSKGYGQTPQLEGPFAGELLFGGTPSAPPFPVEGQHPQKDATVNLASSNFAPLDTLNSLLRISEKLIDMAAGGDSRTLSTTRTASEYIVYVHGISRHVAGYSDPLFASLSPHLQRTLTKQEVIWSHHVNPHSVDRATEGKVSQLAGEIHEQLRQRSTRIGQRASTDRGDGFGVDDFARYMHIEATRNAIIAEFDAIVRPLLSAGHSVQIVSHSWGTVVAYEGLRRLDNESLSGRVKNLFTLGSALSIGRVQSNLFGRVTDGRLPTHVDRIINLDAAGDIVGGPIGDEFVVAREYTGLEPTGCTTVPIWGVALNPRCAHSSYFERDNLEVNRDILARFIN